MEGDGLLGSLMRAVDASPNDIELRVHLAQLLMDAGRNAEALDHSARVIAARPSHTGALRIGATAAAATGDSERAASYRGLLDALGHAGAPQVDAVPRSPGGRSETAPEPVGLEKLREGEPLEDEIAIDAFLEGVLESADAARPTVRLADVGGLAEVKRRLEISFLKPMRNPALRKMYGKSLRGGLLLYGPPGCGKTFLARAVAGELGARFIAVGIHDVLDMWLGSSERNLRELFQLARRSTPSVLFFDEIDALGQKRSQMRLSAARSTVVQLLAELDGVRDENEGVFVLAATNQPWDVDPALRRPGRLDRTLLVLPPDEEARSAILAYHLRHRPVEAVDLDALARRTDGFSGADLRLLCESAAERALASSVDEGIPRPIDQADFDASIADVSPTTRAWFQVARNFAMFSNDGGSYDDLLAYIRAHGLD